MQHLMDILHNPDGSGEVDLETREEMHGERCREYNGRRDQPDNNTLN